MLMGRRTAAQFAELRSSCVHLSLGSTVGKERGHIRVTGLLTAVRKNRPLVLRSNIASSWTTGGGGGILIKAMQNFIFCCCAIRKHDQFSPVWCIRVCAPMGRV